MNKGYQLNSFENNIKKSFEAMNRITQLNSFGNNIKKSFEVMDRITQLNSFGNNIKKSFEAMDRITQLNSFGNNIKKSFEAMDKINKLNSFENNIKKFSETMNIINELNSFENNIKKSFEAMDRINKLNSNDITELFEAISRTTKLNSFGNNLNLEDISKDEIEELKNDLYSINNADNLQIKFSKITNKWAKKNPIIAFVLVIIITYIIESTFSLCLNNIINIKESNNNKAPIIKQTIINNITIIGDEKHYYRVETQNENGDTIKGYVSKRKYNQIKSNKLIKNNS